MRVPGVTQTFFMLGFPLFQGLTQIVLEAAKFQRFEKGLAGGGLAINRVQSTAKQTPEKLPFPYRQLGNTEPQITGLKFCGN